MTIPKKTAPNPIKALVEKHRRRIVEMRRELHRIPETAYTEEKTAACVAQWLSALGLDVQTGIARFGVVGTLTFSRPGPTLMLRSELDALPVAEETGLPFASVHDGRMHACGHDGHMAMVLGAAMVLGELEENLCGGVKFVFQPAEEGPGGAAPMIAAGVMDAPRVDYCLACHLWPGCAEGTVGVRDGPVMAAMDRFDLTMGGEDMAFFLERAPGCFFFLGVGRPDGAPLHSSRFDFDEAVLPIGVEIYCRAALDLLGADAGRIRPG